MAVFAILCEDFHSNANSLSRYVPLAKSCEWNSSCQGNTGYKKKAAA